jgi:hypothetical protein
MAAATVFCAGLAVAPVLSPVLAQPDSKAMHSKEAAPARGGIMRFNLIWLSRVENRRHYWRGVFGESCAGSTGFRREILPCGTSRPCAPSMKGPEFPAS